MALDKIHYNLLEPLNGESSYHIDTFPDGEKQIVVYEPLKFAKETNNIVTRISTMDDLFILMQLISILKRYNIKYHVFITYLLGQRNDRVMEYGKAVNLGVIVNFLLSNGCEMVNFSFCELHNDSFDAFRYTNIVRLTNIIMQYELKPENIILVYPDKGACDRYDYYLGDLFETMECTKERYVGLEYEKRIKINVPLAYKYASTDNEFVVIDDICDGGGTFVVLAEELNLRYPNRKKTLVVTHAVNLEGLKKVSKYYDNVIITDSFKNWEKEDLPKNIKVLKCTELIKKYAW